MSKNLLIYKWMRLSAISYKYKFQSYIYVYFVKKFQRLYLLLVFYKEIAKKLFRRQSRKIYKLVTWDTLLLRHIIYEFELSHCWKIPRRSKKKWVTSKTNFFFNPEIVTLAIISASTKKVGLIFKMFLKQCVH